MFPLSNWSKYGLEYRKKQSHISQQVVVLTWLWKALVLLLCDYIEIMH